MAHLKIAWLVLQRFINYMNEACYGRLKKALWCGMTGSKHTKTGYLHFLSVSCNGTVN